ncbi:hypothetical protein C2G38_2143167 [Gigaspora rosea]|uniref:Uncharacterized protein n=1 Tax=Gigaspora rosea TaxID=44941 RepID=A0A397V2R1_9GLOM|nr:hypothetical protein C2G38_2143167 [Gigaspora rosea]
MAIFMMQFILLHMQHCEETQCLFGINPFIEEWQEKLDDIFIQLIKKKPRFGAEDGNISIKKYVKSALFVATPNVVILQPGEPPSKNKHVHHAIDMFFEDFGYTENGKAMCSALIAAFSGYGLFGLAKHLGVRTRKYRYAESVTRFLSDLQNNSQLFQDLQKASSINLIQEDHYFAIDEGLETFGVKFVKENMTGQATNSDNLK